MAKATKSGGQVKRQARRVIPAIRRQGARAKAAAAKVNVTLGDLIAAAFDTVGTEVRSVAQVLGSRDMTRMTGRKIIFV
jgi:hypothetical protein